MSGILERANCFQITRCEQAGQGGRAKPLRRSMTRDWRQLLMTKRRTLEQNWQKIPFGVGGAGKHYIAVDVRK